MTSVHYFSGSGHSREIAGFFAEKLQTNAIEISGNAPVSLDTAVVVFPVYCQNIPVTVLPFLKSLKAENAVLIAVYGGIAHGNVLWEASRLICGRVIAAAYVPTGHSFMHEGTAFDFDSLIPIIGRIKKPCEAKITRTPKNPLANFFPAWRSRVGLKLVRTDACNFCNLCGESCPMDAVVNGKTNSKCIRCLRCVTVCPEYALQIKPCAILGLYLKRKKKNETVIFL